MNKKNMGLLFLIVLGVVFLFLYKFSVEDKKTGNDLYQMSGLITEAKVGSVVVKGPVRAFYPNEQKKEERTIEFMITPETILENTVSIITEKDAKSGKTFKPATEVRIGKISDIVTNLRIIAIQSEDNLFERDKAVAIKVNYATYDFQISAK